MRSVLILLICCWAAIPLRGTEFDAANQLYDEGKYAEARAAYEQLVAAGRWSANLFYNLGNTHHRLGAPGQAMLEYERALTLDPQQPEARLNLAFLRGQTGAIPWPAAWTDHAFPRRWANAIAIAGALAAWVAVFAVAVLLVNSRGERLTLWCVIVGALLVAGYSGVALWQIEQHRALAIVTATAAEVHVAPAESSAVGSTLPAGSEVRLLSERGDWVYCALPGQNRGWIPAKSLQRVLLGTS